MRILIAEDNPKIALALQKGLGAIGYAADILDRAADIDIAGLATSYDLLVLDVMLPDRDGIELCRELRQRGAKTPVLMLTALGDTEQKIAGLNAGADDYMTKPFEFEEFIARVRALLRRGHASEGDVLRVADLSLDLERRTVTRAGQKIPVTAKEFALLEYFVRHADRVLSRDRIGEHVWDMNFDAGSNVIDVYVSALRRKIDKGFDRPLLHTRVGSGYVLSATEHESSLTEPPARVSTTSSATGRDR